MLTLETIKSVSLQTNIGICRNSISPETCSALKGHTIYVKIEHERRMSGIMEE
jgi:hypothetical protein